MTVRTASLVLDDTSSMRSSSLARTSIASGCTTSAATTTATTQNNNLDSCSWTESTHSGTDADGLGPVEHDVDDDIDMNHEIFIKTANEFMLSPRCNGTNHNLSTATLTVSSQ